MPPVVEGVKRHCGRYYAVYTGSCDVQAGVAEREAAGKGARFVDARQKPFVQCDCGLGLDFSPECPALLQQWTREIEKGTFYYAE